MLIPKKISNTRKLILTLFLVIIVGVILYLLFINFVTPQISSGGGSVPLFVGETFQPPAVDTELETGFLKQAPFTQLEQNANLPVQPGSTGRTDPFRQINFGN